MLCSGDRVVVGGRLDEGLLSKGPWCSEEVCVCCHSDLCSDGWSERLELGDYSELCDTGDLLTAAESEIICVPPAGGWQSEKPESPGTSL